MQMNPRNGPNVKRSTIVGTKGPSVILLIIDPQVDFHEGGSLAILGATDDSYRISDMIMSNIDKIDEIYVTLDSHHVNHIAHQSFWEWGQVKGKDPKQDPRCDFSGQEEKSDEGGALIPKDNKIRPAKFATIFSHDVKDGTWVPVDRSLRDYCIAYTQLLEKKGKFTLTIWPNHCLIGTVGHSVVPNVNEALQAWTRRRMKIVNFIHKGMNCLTEMYSAIEAEVPVSTDPTTTRNHELLRKLRHPRRLVVCGQALSHCVCWTVYDIVNDWKSAKCSLSSMHLLEDGSSPVSVGDYPEKAKLFLKEMEEIGVQIAKCSEAFQGI